MGIVNVTPDSFSDGGCWLAATDAIAHGTDLVSQGADILDVGGESTRPGASRTDLGQELARVIPVVEGLVTTEVPISVDTMRSKVAASAIKAGARIINDVSGGRADPEILRVVADAGVDYLLMHWRGHSDVMARFTDYRNVVAEVRSELLAGVELARKAGIAAEHIIIDVGLGFAKTSAQNWELLRHIDEFNELGYRQLVGASRKRFLGEINGKPAEQRDHISSAVTMWCAQQRVWGVRTHSVTEHLEMIQVASILEDHPTAAKLTNQPN